MDRVVFTDHFFFLPEHRLALQLEDLCREYRARAQAGRVDLLSRKLAALRDAKASVQRRLLETGVMNPGGLSHADEASQRLRPRLAEYVSLLPFNPFISVRLY